MEKRTYIYIAIFVFIVVFAVSAIYFLVFPSGPIASPENVKSLDQQCKVASYNGEDALNFVFFSSGNLANQYADYLLEQKPFADYGENFNVFFIDNVNVDSYCEIYQGIALLCRDSGLIRAAAACPHDYIVVLDEKPSSVRSSAYQNIISLNSAHPFSVFVHEFGHVFANLAEEYVAGTAKIPRGSKNCVDDCEEYEGRNDGCFEGCSRSNYKRSVQNGVMRTLTPPAGVMYGSFNEYLVSQRLDEELGSLFGKITGSISRITGRATLDSGVQEGCGEKEYALQEIEYKKGVLELASLEVNKGCAGVGGVGEFDYTLENAAGEEIYSRSIEPLEVLSVGPGEIDEEGFMGIEESVDEVSEGTFYITAPVTEDTANMVIADPTGAELEIDLATAGGRPCAI